MALLFGSPFAMLLERTDDEDGSPLPPWAMRPELRPPTMSLVRPVEVFDRIVEQGVQFETFANCGDAFQPAMCFCCSVCLVFLVEPATCNRCQQAVCTQCWEKHRAIAQTTDYGCPLCRHQQPSIAVSLCMQQVLENELRSKGISFNCNAFPPGSRADALWCCQASFDNLKELRQHLSLAGPFRTTRIHLRRMLTLALSGSKCSQELIFADPAQRQKLATILEEDEVVAKVSRRRLLVQRAGRSRSRSPKSDRP